MLRRSSKKKWRGSTSASLGEADDADESRRTTSGCRSRSLQPDHYRTRVRLVVAQETLSPAKPRALVPLAGFSLRGGGRLRWVRFRLGCPIDTSPPARIAPTMLSI